MKKTATSLFFFLQLFLISNLTGQESSLQIGGYLKNLSTYQDGSFPGMPADLGKLQNTFQARLNLNWYAPANLTASLQSRHLLIWQRNIKSNPGFFNSSASNNYYFDLETKTINQENIQANSEIDRIYLDWTLEKLQLTAGRQRIAWGAALVWNPTDLFNPFNILDFDYEERPGTDAFLAQYYFGPLSQIDLAISPGKHARDVIYALRYYFNYRDIDLNLIAGWQRKGLRLGGSWAGQIYDGGFRGEILYSKADMRYNPAQFSATPLPYALPDKKIDKAFFTCVLSYDYTWENSFYVHTEYLYNGLGATKNAAARRLETLATGELSPARHSIFQEFAYNFTPLWRGNVFFIINPSDLSWIGAPSVEYSLSENWEAYLLAFPSAGKKNSEFGEFPGWYFCRFKYSF